jgi:hypothetical protein
LIVAALHEKATLASKKVQLRQSAEKLPENIDLTIFAAANKPSKGEMRSPKV